jgi:hypothetical protein
MSRAAAVVAAILLVPVSTASAQSPSRVPTAVIERVVNGDRQTVRLTVFDNRVAVVSKQEGGEQVFFRLLTLQVEEYEALREVVVADAPAAAVAALRRGGGVGGARARIRIVMDDGSVGEIPYTTGSVLDLAGARLVAVLDDLEDQVSEVSEYYEELRAWRPEEGDLVELVTGARARVVEVHADGSVTLAHEDVAIRERVPEDVRSERIRRVVEDSP